MFGFDLLTLMLVAGVVVLVISTTAMVMTMTPTARERRRGTSHSLSPSAAHALALARAAAVTHTVDEARTAGALGAGRVPTGQIIDISDGRLTGRGTATEMTVEYAQALAEHVADTDPQFVAEVISQWIRADSSDPGAYR